MPRPREFDPDEVRARVTEVFTTHGYRGTSLAMLSEAAGLGKQSLYNSFGDKQALYLQSLDCASGHAERARQLMAAAPSGRAAIEAFFGGLLQACSSDDPAERSCIVSAGLLEGIEEEPVLHKLREKWHSTEVMLNAAVQRGQKDGSIRKDIPSADIARLLMALVGGLRVSVRAAEDSAPLQRTIKLGLQFMLPPE